MNNCTGWLTGAKLKAQNLNNFKHDEQIRSQAVKSQAGHKHFNSQDHFIEGQVLRAKRRSISLFSRHVKPTI
ncbi:hypothetical protein EYC84_001650 [Monilinia fructicola]|uniref:Uncharacterized protein n=1 Tax=Monilinia fructicola TaxID=38448 RepID=A0A5M9JSR9_MONFR|nr:hypothetical protein EYC84_001650 [Monilinia fructicola]